MARSRFSFEKRRKELEKKKKKEAKREARAERKAAGEPAGAPVVEIDEWGNPIVVEEEIDEEAAADAEGAEGDEATGEGAAEQP